MLPRLAFARPSAPFSPAVLWLMVAAFVLPGLAGHDLWKSHDAIGLGIVHDMARSGDYLVPRVSGQLWLADPPLYHWLAAAFGAALAPFMAFHSAARLASGACMLAAVWLLYRAARDWSEAGERRVSGAAALLVLLGSVGLMVHAHEAVPELAALAALCGALAALPHAATRPAASGAAFGAALGVAFLSAHWVAPAALFLATATAHLACPQWRRRSAVLFLALAALTAGAMAVLWPLALASRSPQLFAAWTLEAFSPRPFGEGLRAFLGTASWFAWPAWPLALWTLWSERRRWNEPQLFTPAAAALLMFPALAYWSSTQDVNLIPLLAPLALLAAPGIHRLRRGAAAALDWFGLVTFAFFTGLVWLGYVAMMTGVPPRVASNFARAAPGFVPQFELAPLVAAIGLALGWAYLMFFTGYSPARSVARWAAGVVLLWGTFAMLWMPWADYQKSYRAVALQLRARLPAEAPCIAERGLGVPQAAALAYHGGIRTRPFDFAAPRACPLLLVQGSPQHELDAPGPGWSKLAEAGRPGDRSERYRLYRLDR